MLEPEHFSGARKAGLNLVGDQNDAVLVAQRSERSQEVERSDIESALPLHRLDDDSGDARGVRRVFKQGHQSSEALLAAHSVIGVREGDVVDVGGKRSEALLVRHDLAGQRHAHMGAAMEAAAERDNPRAAGKSARDLDRVLHGFRAGRDQHGLGRACDGRDRIQPLGQAHVGFHKA